MTSLDRKVLRDVWSLRGQFSAIGAVIACGIGTFVMSLSTLDSLELTQARYYEHYRFGHIFARLKRAPVSLRPRLEELPGIAEVQLRVVADVVLDVPGLAEPAVGRLISVPESGAPKMNALYLRSGRFLEPGRAGEALVSEAFADAHALAPGDKLSAVINGRRETLSIVGIVLSPEYVYQIRGGEVFPNERSFGIFWVAEKELAAAFDMEGAFNDLSCYLSPGAREADILARIDRLIDPYGGLGAYAREDQESHRYLTNEIRELRNMGLFAPIIFLLVAAFLLNVVLSRIVGAQREIIAALKAFGYTRGEIGWHYAKMVLTAVVVGVLLGIGLGAWLGRGLTNMYTRFFHFPLLEYHLAPRVALAALGITAGAAAAGTLVAVRRAVRLPPAEAMRPEPPAQYRPTLLERWGLGPLFSHSTRIILRNLERNRGHAALAILGIALAAAILVLGNFIGDALDDLIELEFDVMHHEDVTVTLIEPTTHRALYEIDHLPGVMRSEPFRAVPVRLRSGHWRRRTEILGLGRESQLVQLLDEARSAMRLPPGGIVLSDKLAELLHVSEGDWLTVEILEGDRAVRQVPATAFVSDFVGTSAYMDLRALNELMREGSSISGAFLRVDSHALPAIYARLKTTPQVAAATVKEAARRSLLDTLSDTLLRMKAVNVLFAAIIAFGVVYNTARVSVAERSRELASLRVLGFTRAEISYILLGELAILTLAALGPGLIIGYGLAWFASWGYDTDMFRIPLVIQPFTYALASSIVISAAISSGLIVRRQLDELDLVAVLKTRE